LKRRFERVDRLLGPDVVELFPLGFRRVHGYLVEALPRDQRVLEVVVEEGDDAVREVLGEGTVALLGLLEFAFALLSLRDVAVRDDDRHDVTLVVRDGPEDAVERVLLAVGSREVGLEVDVLAGRRAFGPSPDRRPNVLALPPPRRLPERLAGHVSEVGVDVLHRRPVDIQHRPVGLEQPDEDVRILEDRFEAPLRLLEFLLALSAFGDVAEVHRDPGLGGVGSLRHGSQACRSTVRSWSAPASPAPV